MLKFKFLILFLIVLSQLELSAQNDTTEYSFIKLIDGTELYGTVESENDSIIVFSLPSGITIDIPLNTIKERRNAEISVQRGKIFKEDPFDSRLFFAPTAKMLRPGLVKISIYELFFPFITVGISDFLTISGGFSIFPGLVDQVFYIAPKAKLFTYKRIDFSAGAIYAGFDKNKFGIVYAVSTLTTEKTAFTLGVGYGYDQDEIAQKPVIVFGAEIQISESSKLITENWIITGSSLIYSFGIRVFGEKVAGDFGLFGTSERSSGFPFFPWIGIGFNL